jgi:hypothetical protein
MKNSKLLIFINLILLCGSLTLSADESKKPAAQTNADKKPVSIRFVPGYKKHDRETGIEDTYKRTIMVEIDKTSDDKTLQKLAEDECLNYNVKQRENYAVSFVKHKKAKVEKTILCSTFDGPMIEGSTFDKPPLGKPNTHIVQ